jgi:hypothetical protein
MQNDQFCHGCLNLFTADILSAYALHKVRIWKSTSTSLKVLDFISHNNNNNKAPAQSPPPQPTTTTKQITKTKTFNRFTHYTH